MERPLALHLLLIRGFHLEEIPGLVYHLHGRVLSSLLHLDWWVLGFQQLLHPLVYRNSAGEPPDNQSGLWPNFAHVMRAAMSGDQDS